MISTLLVDDSASFRALLAAVLAEAGDFRIVGTARRGEEAVDLARALRPSLVVMDVMMPGLDGIEACGRIMREAPCAVVVMSSLMDADAQGAIFRALQAGAVEALGKPDLTVPAARARLVDALRAMAAVKVVRHRPHVRASAQPPGPRTVKVLALGASTGGPPALCEVLRGLGPSFTAPVVVAQHLAHGFGPGLARWLQDAGGRPVTLVEGREALVPGRVFLPVDGSHLEVVGGDFVHAVPASDEDGPVPSVSRLFDSLVPHAPTTAACLLTGMGADGAEALLRLRQAGAHTIAQDEESSLVWGMPRVAHELGAALETLPLDAVGPRLTELVSQMKMNTRTA